LSTRQNNANTNTVHKPNRTAVIQQETHIRLLVSHCLHRLSDCFPTS